MRKLGVILILMMVLAIYSLMLTSAGIELQLDPPSDRRAIVQIAAFDQAGRFLRSGSGIIIRSDGLILTNVHVIRDIKGQACEIKIEGDIEKEAPLAKLLVVLVTEPPPRDREPPMPQFTAQLIAEKPELDLALLQITHRIEGKGQELKNLEDLKQAVSNNKIRIIDLDEQPNLPFLRLWDFNAVREGEEVKIRGYPTLSPLPRLTLSMGSILQIQEEGTFVVERAFVTFGFSGGAIIDKQNNLVTGILCGGKIFHTTAGPLVLALARSINSKVWEQLLSKAPQVKGVPVARFTFTPDFPKLGEEVTFDASASFDPDTPPGTPNKGIIKYEWDFDGDGKADATGLRVTRRLTSLDPQVTLTVTDNTGLSNSTKQRVVMQREIIPSTVHILGREGSFSTIQEAIETAQPGDTVLIGPGARQENLVIRKSLILQGAGRELVTLFGNGQDPVVTIQGEGDKVIDVIIKGFEIRNGRQGIRVLGNVSVTVQDNTVARNQEHGVDIALGAKATVINNYIEDNGGKGISIAGASADIKNNIIRGNGDGGILIKSLLRGIEKEPVVVFKSKVILSDNTLEDNTGIGVFTTFSAETEILGGKITKPKPDIWGDWTRGIVVDEDAQLTIENAEILDHDVGITLFSSVEKRITITDTKISGKVHGIEAKAASWFILDHSIIFNSSKSRPRPLGGVFMFDRAKSEIKNSIIRDNLFGTFVFSSAQTSIISSQISNNSRYGIFMDNTASTTVIDSHIENNGNGIFAAGSAWISIYRSSISDNHEGLGILLWDSVRLTLQDSQILRNSVGIDCRGCTELAVLNLQNNTIQDNRSCGIRVAVGKGIGMITITGGGNRLVRNVLCGNVPASIRIPLVTQTERSKIVVPQDFVSLQEAVDAIKEGGTIIVLPGTYSENVTIYKSLYLRGAGAKDVTLSGSGHDTLSICCEAEHVRIEGVTIKQGFFSNLWIETGPTTRVNVAKVNIRNSASDGLVIGGFAEVKLSNAEILGNIADGIFVIGSPQVSIISSRVSGNEDDGIDMKYSVQTQIHILNSTISGNQDIGISLSSDTQADMQNNKILGNRGWGIAAFIRDCFPKRRDVPEKFEGVVAGGDNEVHGNEKGDFCPPYPGPPWPEGFVKEAEG